MNETERGILGEFNELMSSDYSVGLYGFDQVEAENELLKMNRKGELHGSKIQNRKAIKKISKLIQADIDAENKYYWERREK